ncbi:MAG: cyclic nucleotide-binding domain-containing protein [Myxococcota bacterium]
MQVTFGSLKNYVNVNLSGDNRQDTLKGALALIKADNFDLDSRFIIYRVLKKYAPADYLENYLKITVQLAVQSGHPASALAFIHIYKLEFDEVDNLFEFATDYYNKDSDKISPHGSRVAPLTDNSPVDSPSEDKLEVEELILEIYNQAVSTENWNELPAKVMPMPLLSDLDKKSFLKVAKELTLHLIKPDTMIIREGEIGESFYILAKGKVSVFTVDTRGVEKHLANLRQGSIFGEMALVQRMPRSASVKSEEECAILEFTTDNLADMSDALPLVAEALDKFTRNRLLKNLLNQAPIFKPFSKKQRKDLLSHFKAYVVEPDTVIVKEGNEGAGLYLILSGEVDVIKNYQSKEQLKLATLSSADSFGEISLIKNKLTTASVVANSRTTLFFLAKHYFVRLTENVPELEEYFKKLGDKRLTATNLLVSQSSNLESNDEEENEVILI